MKRDHSIQCSVCSRWFTTGGRRGERGASKGLPPLCPAHYHRALRKSPRAKDPTPGQPKRSTKAERLQNLVRCAETLVDRLDAISSELPSEHFSSVVNGAQELSHALIVWNVGAR